MKNILKTLTVTAALVSMSGGVAFAETITCNSSITNTGPGSSNTISCVDVNEKKVTCDNNLVIINENDQSAGSGGAFTTDNTTGGNAGSGNAENQNSTVVTVGASCSPVETTPPTTPTTPVVSGASTAGAAATPQVLGVAAQVAVKPVGGAGAGAGAGVASNNAAATTGILASLGMIAAGIALRKNALGRN